MLSACVDAREIVVEIEAFVAELKWSERRVCLFIWQHVTLFFLRLHSFSVCFDGGDETSVDYQFALDTAKKKERNG